MRLNIILFAAGVALLQQQAKLPDLQWAWLILPLLLLAFLFFTRSFRFSKVVGQVILVVSFFAGGFFWAAGFAQHRLADELAADWESRDVQVVGVIAGLPQPGDRSTRFEFDVEQTETPQAKIPSHISLAWYVSGFRSEVKEPLPTLHVGERWRLTVRLKRPHGNANPYGFDFEAWLLENNIRASGYVRKDDNNTRLEHWVNRPSYWVEHYREVIRDRIQSALPGAPYAGVLVALAMGDQRAIPASQWQVFARTGVSHLMSISGLHVTMFSGLAFALIYALWRRSSRLTLTIPARKAAAVAGALAALVYVLLAGFGVPAQRTLYMLTVVAIGLFIGRSGSASRVLCWALFVVLLLDPWAVLSAGFWLSFGAVAVILFVATNRIGEPGWLRTWGSVQWAITLGMAPMTLALFQQLSLISPVANAFAIPVVSWLVVPITLLGVVLPIDALLHFAHWIMQLCMVALIWLSNLPDAVWQQHAPPLWTIIIGSIGVLWLLLPRGFPARWLGLVALLPMFLVFPLSPPPGVLWLTVLDVGQGLSVVAQTAHHNLLYDTGPTFTPEADSGNRIIVPFMRSSGIIHLDGVIVTHKDDDHSGGALSVLQAVPYDWFASSLTADHKIIQASHGAIPCYAGQYWEWDGVRFDMLHPDLDSYELVKLKANDRSCVLKITTAFGSVLLTGDIEKLSERQLLARNAEVLASTVMVVPHHGSKTSSTDAFVEQVHPQYAIFTAGYRNRFGHPKEEVLERYRDINSQIYRSDRDGALTLKFERAGKPAISATRDDYRRYWRAFPDLTQAAAEE